MTQIFKDNETVIVARGSKALPKDSQVTILGYDATADTYAVKTDAGSIKTAKAASLAAVPERTFTESEVKEALDYARDTHSNAPATAGDVTDTVAESLKLTY